MSKTAIEKYIDEIRLVQSATHTDEQYRAFNICVGIATKYIEHPVSQSREVFEYPREYLERAIGAGLSIGYGKEFDIFKKEEMVQYIINSLPKPPTVPLTDEMETMYSEKEIFILLNKIQDEGLTTTPHTRSWVQDYKKEIQQHLQSLK